jgi:hypothetical protein
LEEQILELLKQKSGNVKMVAMALGLSHSYVNRIKRRHAEELKRSKAEIVTLPDEDEARLEIEVLKPNFPDVASLRDLTLQQLSEKVVTGEMSDRDAVRLLEVILRFESSTRANTQPKHTNIYQDNRSVQVMIEQLSTMDTDKLRALAGLPEPVVLEIEDGKIKTDNLHSHN